MFGLFSKFKKKKKLNLDQSKNWLEFKRQAWNRDYKHIPWKEFRDDYFKNVNGEYVKIN